MMVGFTDVKRPQSRKRGDGAARGRVTRTGRKVGRAAPSAPRASEFGRKVEVLVASHGALEDYRKKSLHFSNILRGEFCKLLRICLSGRQ
jgi:hypothetical protein